MGRRGDTWVQDLCLLVVGLLNFFGGGVGVDVQDLVEVDVDEIATRQGSWKQWWKEGVMEERAVRVWVWGQDWNTWFRCLWGQDKNTSASCPFAPPLSY